MTNEISLGRRGILDTFTNMKALTDLAIAYRAVDGAKTSSERLDAFVAFILKASSITNNVSDDALAAFMEKAAKHAELRPFLETVVDTLFKPPV